MPILLNLHIKEVIMIDLHLHLGGSMPPELVLKFAKEQNIKLPTFDLEELKTALSVPQTCESLNDYLNCFIIPHLLIIMLSIIIGHQACYPIEKNDFWDHLIKNHQDALVKEMEKIE